MYFDQFTDVTDMLGETNFLVKYLNGFKFETATDVKKEFAELAVAYLEANLTIE